MSLLIGVAGALALGPAKLPVAGAPGGCRAEVLSQAWGGVCPALFGPGMSSGMAALRSLRSLPFHLLVPLLSHTAVYPGYGRRASLPLSRVVEGKQPCCPWSDMFVGCSLDALGKATGNPVRISVTSLRLKSVCGCPHS